MKDKKLIVSSIIIIAAAIVVLLFSIFGGIGGGKTPAVLLPGSGSDTAGDSSLANVTPKTVQSVIATLSRPDSYSCAVTTEDFWGEDGYGKSTLQVWVMGEFTRIQLTENSREKNILVSADGIWIWYSDNSAQVFHADAAQGTDADRWMRAVTYEELMDMDADSITAAGYAKYAGESCVWAEYTTPELGYRCREYISVNTGILMGTESWDGTKLVYRMKCGTPSVAPQDAVLFKAPDA